MPHFMGFITAGLDVLKSLQDGRLGKNFSHTQTQKRKYTYIYNFIDTIHRRSALLKWSMIKKTNKHTVILGVAEAQPQIV